MTEGILNGRLMRLTADGEKLIHPQECSLQISTETRATASKDIPDGWTDAESGAKSWTSSINGLYSLDATVDEDGSPVARANAEAFFDLVEVGDKIDVELLTGVTGDIKFSGKAIITSLEYNFPNNDNATYSISFTGAGPLVKETITA